MDKAAKENIGFTERSVFSRIYFCWIWPILNLGRKRSLSFLDIPPVPLVNSCNFVGNCLINAWYLKTSTKQSLWRVILRVYWFRISFLGILYLASQLLQIGRSLLLRYFLEAYSSDPDGKFTWQLALLLILSSAFNALTINPWNFLSSELGMDMSNALTALIYHKSLRLSAKGLSQTNQGQLVNLVSNDVKRLETRIGIIHALWVGPLVTLAAILILIKYNPGATVGLGVLAIVILASRESGFGFFMLFMTAGRIGIESSRTLRKIAICRDARLKILNEITSNIRQIKTYCWESVFEDKVTKIRSNEIGSLKRMWTFWAVYRTFYMSPRFVVFVALLAALFINGTLNPENVFLVTTLYYTVSSLMSQAFPSALYLLTNINVTIRRCQDFLMLDEHPHCLDFTSGGPLIESPSSNGSISIQNFTATRANNTDLALHEINITCTSSKPLFLLGPVGSGKSTLFSAICGDLEPIQGSIIVEGKLAYVRQTPWTFPATIRENITFGKAFDLKWYQQVLEACDLSQDIAGFPRNDLEILSDKGISLSGGQKARLSLARAVYADRDVYLLDNILSAVDATVGAHILNNIVFGLLKEKCVIMATNPLPILENYDCVYMENGKIVDTGTFKNILTKRPLLLWSKASPEAECVLNVKIANSRNTVKPQSKNLEKSTLTTYGTFPDSNDSAQMLGEEMGPGTFGTSIIAKYIFGSGGKFWPIVVGGILLLFQVFQTTTDFMLMAWTNANKSGTTTRSRQASMIYTALVAADIIIGLLGLKLFYNLCTQAGQQLHRTSMQSLLRTKLSFFSINTTGSVLNRFSMDMGSIDEYLPQVIEAALSSILQVVGILAIAVILNDILLGPAAILAVVFLQLRKFYLRPSSNLRRMEAIARSPVYTHFNTTMDGLGTIRTLEQQDKFTQLLYGLKDNHTAMYYTFLAAFNWFIFWMDVLVLLFCSFAITAFLLFPKDTAATGLAISLIFSADNIFSYGMQQTAELGNELVSVERMLEYGALEPEEKSDNLPNVVLKEKLWKPTHGAIEFQSVDVSYAEGAATLHNINLKIEPGERVGVVGRTGSGKTTLISSLLRLVDTTFGAILVDRTDVRNIPLHELRSSISVISQATALVEGSLRHNLDIHNKFVDAQLWEVLTAVQLNTKFECDGLQTMVEAGGENFSHGERQLLCLARALLSQNKILLLDEINANVDKKTANIMQNIIEENFENCTVVTIAHNLDIVLHSDKIIVMEGGEIRECGTPAVLLDDKFSMLNNLIRTDLQHDRA